MRIAELSRSTGVPVPTIKYYLREGLLPPGDLTSPNQAWYGDRHVQRLRLVRALVEVGRLPIAAISELLADLDRPDPNVHRLLGRALKAAGPGRTDDADDALADAERETDELLTRHGWRVGSEAPARRAVAEVIVAWRQLGMDNLLEQLDGYADVARRIAAVDLTSVQRQTEPADMVRTAVIGTILGDVLIAALRRLAQEDGSARVFGTEPDGQL